MTGHDNAMIITCILASSVKRCIKKPVAMLETVYLNLHWLLFALCCTRAHKWKTILWQDISGGKTDKDFSSCMPYSQRNRRRLHAGNIWYVSTSPEVSRRKSGHSYSGMWFGNQLRIGGGEGGQNYKLSLMIWSLFKTFLEPFINTPHRLHFWWTMLLLGDIMIWSSVKFWI